MPRRISRRSASVNESSIAARRRNPSHASTSSSTAAAHLAGAATAGVVSGRFAGGAASARGQRYQIDVERLAWAQPRRAYYHLKLLVAMRVVAQQQRSRARQVEMTRQ